MKKNTDLVISRQNLPSSFGFGALVAYWLLLVHFNAPTWAFYLFYAFAAIVTVAALARMISTTQIDLMAIAEAIQVKMSGECECAGVETEPAVEKNSFILAASQIHYERMSGSTVRVSLRDANGKVLYRFRDVEIPDGTALTINDVRIEVDVHIN